LLVATLGCAGDADLSDAGAGTGDSGSSDADDTLPGQTTSGTTSPPATSSTTQSSGDDTTTGASLDSSGDDTGATLDGNGCPVNAPASWVSCENFDAIDDPTRQLSQWNVNGDAFGVEADDGAPGDRALRVSLTPGVMFGGWVTLRFGDGPDAPAVDSPGETFDEVWVRYSLRIGDDWPGRHIGDVGEIIAMNGANWAIAADLNIQGDPAFRLHPFGWTCIFGGVQSCDGSNDWGGALQLMWDVAGPSEIFGASAAGQTLCMEAHMRLNTPGRVDGEARVWVDGSEEFSRTGIDWRGTWDDDGLNAIRFTNYASPTDQPLSFFVDDVVVATERIGCD
jgi:hypothetical protein